jgi:uncharacterized protein (TIGR03435 family)
MKRSVAAFVCVFLFPLFSAAQATPGKPAFVSATVKELPTTLIMPMQELAETKAGKKPTKPKIGPYVDAEQVEYDSMSLKDLIKLAYKVRDYQITGPGWLDDKGFDIVAKMPDGASIDDAPMMLQSLLEDRFKLAVHRASKEQQVMGLMVAKGGLKLTPASNQPAGVKGKLGPNEISITTADGTLLILDNGREGATIKSDAMTMAGLADLLTRFSAGNPEVIWKLVVDQTGLQGAYQVSFDTKLPAISALRRSCDWIATYRQHGAISQDWIDLDEALNPTGYCYYCPPDPVIFQSVQTMGLKLELSKAPIEMLVVDHAEKNPTAN